MNLGLAAASGAMAAATAALIENPVRFSPAVSGRHRRSLALGAGLTATALAVAGLGAATIPSVAGATRSRPPAPLGAPVRAPDAVRASPAVIPDDVLGPVQAALAAGATAEQVPSNLRPSLSQAHGDKAAPFVDGCNNTYTDAVPHRCVYENTTAAGGVLLFGDSHAAQWFPAVDGVARDRGWRFTSLTKATCPPMPLPVWSPELGRPFRECDSWRRSVMARIATEKPSVVVIGVARHYGPEYRMRVYGQDWLAALADTVRRVRALGAGVVVMGPTPKPSQDVPECLSAHLGAAAACMPTRVAALDAVGAAAERSAVEGAGGLYVDVGDLVCATTNCPVVVGNLLVYRDDNHLTTTFTGWLSPVVGAVLDNQYLARGTSRESSAVSSPPRRTAPAAPPSAARRRATRAV
jgi:hypothetical protein